MYIYIYIKIVKYIDTHTCCIITIQNSWVVQDIVVVLSADQFPHDDFPSRESTRPALFR